MTPRQPDRRHNDPPQDPEIHRLFHALGPPPVGKAPPDLRAKVLARIEQQRPRPGLWVWLPGWSPAWATACAVVLGLSLGVNIWWSVRTFTGRDAPGGTAGLQIYRFQAGMQHNQEVGRLVAARAVPQEPTAVVGFTPQVQRTAFVHIGIIYTDILGALRGGAVEAAIPRLERLTQLLTKVQAPRALSQYLRMVQTSLPPQQYDTEVLLRFLALFESLYEEAYATRTPIAEEVILFRAGAWLENMSLAAASGDGAAVRQGREAVKALRQALTQLHAPPEALAGLQRLHERTARAVLTDQDLSAAHTLVQQIQAMLSE